MKDLVVPGQCALEIGVGSGFTANYLRSKGVGVTTMDIDRDKEPDIVANVVEHEFEDPYDHVLAFEVFEHIPFEQFRTILNRLAAGACRDYLFLSIPRNRRVWFRCELTLPRLGTQSMRIAAPRRRVMNEHHFWEVDHAGISQDRVEGMFAEAGFSTARTSEAFFRLFYALKSPLYSER